MRYFGVSVWDTQSQYRFAIWLHTEQPTAQKAGYVSLKLTKALINA